MYYLPCKLYVDRGSLHGGFSVVDLLLFLVLHNLLKTLFGQKLFFAHWCFANFCTSDLYRLCGISARNNAGILHDQLLFS